MGELDYNTYLGKDNKRVHILKLWWNCMGRQSILQKEATGKHKRRWKLFSYDAQLEGEV